MTDLDLKRKKLLYQASYRGFKEADLLIGGFAKAHLHELNEAELDEFAALLKHNDREIYDWATDKKTPPEAVLGPVFNRLKGFDIAAMIKNAP